MNTKIGVIVLGVGFILGIFCDRKLRPDVANILTEYKDKIVTETKIVEVPGKSKTTTIVKTEDKKGNTPVKVVNVPGRVNDWSIGTSVDTNLNWGLLTGKRLMNDLWVEFGIYQDKRVSVGLRYEF